MAAVLAVLLVGCGSTSPRTAAAGTTPGTTDVLTSGLRGRTVMVPGCPVERLRIACRALEAPAHIEVRKSGASAVVGQADSAADGTFTIDLPAGRYTVTATVGQGVPTPQTKQIPARVAPDRYTPLVITFDSGIRGPLSR